MPASTNGSTNPNGSGKAKATATRETANVTKKSAVPEPLAALDPNGKAAVLSYNVPEPVSYSGRNFLEIPLPADAFTSIVNGTSDSPSLNTRGAEPVREALPHPAMRVPRDVVVAGGTPDSGPVISTMQPKSERLEAMTNNDVVAAAEAGHQTVLFTNIAGQLDARTMLRDDLDDTDPGPTPTPVYPRVRVFMTAPTDGAQLTGSAAGVTFTASGTSTASRTNRVTMSLSVDGGKPVTVTRNSDGTWARQVTLTTPGVHTIVVTITGEGWSSELDDIVTVEDTVSATLSVTLDKADTTPARVVPTLTVERPGPDTTFIDPSGVVTVTLEGTTKAGSGGAVTSVVVEDGVTGYTVSTKPDTTGRWSAQILVDGAGRHDLKVTAVDSQQQRSLPQLIVARVLASQPLRRLKSRLMLVETLNMSVYAAAFGAGKVCKTMSLLPGEETTISVKSWTKSAETRKDAASIVDSNATEAADSFEDALSEEQTNNVALSEVSNYKIGARASASWGWGSADIDASYSGSANSARAETVKNLRTATRKHSMKASSNRNLTINTEYTVSQEAGAEESTTRKISNINASRTLNFVFRQMNQQHISLIHLTNVRVAYYTEDLALDADGKPAQTTDPFTGKQVLDIRRNYIEAPLPQLHGLLEEAIAPAWRDKVQKTITLALSGIPDYQDKLQTVFEWVTPTQDGTPVPEATYMSFPRNLRTDFTDPQSGQVITVPGIVLAYDHLVMRTDGVIVDAVLGQGEGLDAYSRGLQEVTISERRTAVAERQAEVDRQKLARTLVESGDAERAKIFAQLFPAPVAPAVGTTICTSTPTPSNGVSVVR